MTTTGKIVTAIIVDIVLIASGCAYYLYSSDKIEENIVSDIGFEQQGVVNTLEGTSTVLTRDQIQSESFDQTLASFEADLENESKVDNYDENSFVENSNTSGDLQLEY